MPTFKSCLHFFTNRLRNLFRNVRHAWLLFNDFVDVYYDFICDLVHVIVLATITIHLIVQFGNNIINL